MINVISVDDYKIVNFGLGNIFSETPDIKIIKYCQNKIEFEEFVNSQSPEERNNQIALIDLKLENESGFDCAAFAVSNGINCLIYSSYANAGFVVKAMKHKIRGYITKNADKTEIYYFPELVGVFNNLNNSIDTLMHFANRQNSLSLQDETVFYRLRNNAAKAVTDWEVFNKSLHIFRIVQEVLTNIQKHAQAQTISVLIRTYNENSFRIIISDDGIGFNLKILNSKKNHFGMKNIMARAKAINAITDYKTEPGEGTQFMLTVGY